MKFALTKPKTKKNEKASLDKTKWLLAPITTYYDTLFYGGRDWLKLKYHAGTTYYVEKELEPVLTTTLVSQAPHMIETDPSTKQIQSILLPSETTEYIGIQEASYGYDVFRVYHRIGVDEFALEKCVVMSLQKPSSFHEKDELCERYQLRKIHIER